MKRYDIHETHDFFEYVRLEDGSVPEARRDRIDVAVLEVDRSALPASVELRAFTPAHPRSLPPWPASSTTVRSRYRAGGWAVGAEARGTEKSANSNRAAVPRATIFRTVFVSWGSDPLPLQTATK